jgi:glycosyltransferase involved in cell wall biosynthesis
MLATDVWAPWAHSAPRMLCPPKLSQRYSPTLSGARVVSPALLCAIWNMRYARRPEERWLRIGESFGKFAAKEFARYGLGRDDHVLGFTGGNLEQLIMARQRGAAANHVQVDPGHEWYLTRQLEQEVHPEVEPMTPMPLSAYMERVEQEWQSSDRIVVHSEHSLQCLVRRGVPAAKCVVVPPAFTPSTVARPRQLPGNRPLRVLFVGYHCLAKGFHVFASAARLAGKGFEFISAGSSGLRDSYAESVSDVVQMKGHLPQSAVYTLMESADVFVFPTLSDGFGIVQLEAMSAGLPVIATPPCGAVVRDGIDGFVVPTRDDHAIVDALLRLRANEQLYGDMSQAAVKRAADFSPASHFASLTASAK